MIKMDSQSFCKVIMLAPIYVVALGYTLATITYENIMRLAHEELGHFGVQ